MINERTTFINKTSKIQSNFLNLFGMFVSIGYMTSRNNLDMEGTIKATYSWRNQYYILTKTVRLIKVKFLKQSIKYMFLPPKFPNILILPFGKGRLNFSLSHLSHPRTSSPASSPPPGWKSFQSLFCFVMLGFFMIIN